MIAGREVGMNDQDPRRHPTKTADEIHIHVEQQKILLKNLDYVCSVMSSRWWDHRYLRRSVRIHRKDVAAVWSGTCHSEASSINAPCSWIAETFQAPWNIWGRSDRTLSQSQQQFEKSIHSCQESWKTWVLDRETEKNQRRTWSCKCLQAQ